MTYFLIGDKILSTSYLSEVIRLKVALAMPALNDIILIHRYFCFSKLSKSSGQGSKRLDLPDLLANWIYYNYAKNQTRPSGQKKKANFSFYRLRAKPGHLWQSFRNFRAL